MTTHTTGLQRWCGETEAPESSSLSKEVGPASLGRAPQGAGWWRGGLGWLCVCRVRAFSSSTGTGQRDGPGPALRPELSCPSGWKAALDRGLRVGSRAPWPGCPGEQGLLWADGWPGTSSSQLCIPPPSPFEDSQTSPAQSGSACWASWANADLEVLHPGQPLPRTPHPPTCLCSDPGVVLGEQAF